MKKHGDLVVALIVLIMLLHLLFMLQGCGWESDKIKRRQYLYDCSKLPHHCNGLPYGALICQDSVIMICP